MKKLLLFLTVFISMTYAQGQTTDYHPFPESNAVWNVNFVSGCMIGTDQEYYSITLTGDTSINSQTYHKLFIPFVQSYISGGCTVTNTAGYKGAIRQDTLAKKVFFVPPTASTEQLLYDFTLHIGDTVKGYLESWAYQPDVDISMDSVLVGNNYHKRWKINPCYNIYLIEGIGSTYGLLTLSPGCITRSRQMFPLLVSNITDKRYYPDTTSNCDLITSINTLAESSNQITIFPNPSNGSFTVDFNQSLNFKEIRLTDLLGNIVLQRPTSNQTKIAIDKLQSGTYILTLIDQENRKINKKIISCP